MKKMFTIISVLLISGSVWAQEEILFDGEFTSGGFGGPSFKYSEVLGSGGYFTGGYGGWLINHQFMIGGGGYGLVSKLQSPLDSAEINMGYGGAMFQYIHEPNKIYHFTGSILIGAGGIDQVNDTKYHGMGRPNTFFVIEPAVAAEVNITKYFRIEAGVSYRYVSSYSRYGITEADLRNTAFNLTFKFGKF